MGQVIIDYREIGLKGLALAHIKDSIHTIYCTVFADVDRDRRSQCWKNLTLLTF